MSGEADDVLLLAARISTLHDLAACLRHLRRRQARQRADTELSYRELAARSGYAHGVIGDYFSGKRLPPTDRLDVLASLLGATGEERGALATARDRIDERRRAAGGGPAVARRTLPRDIFRFTGRARELEVLTGETGAGGMAGICAIGGMAGLGKTALAVRAAHLMAHRFPDGQIFVPLHSHTPGQQPAEPAEVLASLLEGSGMPAQQIPAGLEARAGLWRDRLAGKRMLLVLDDASGHEQVRPLLPGAPGCLVLVTSRRRLTALEGARAISLSTLAPTEAARLLIRLADRPGLDPGDPAVGEICRLCGHLPLAVAMLARQLHHHPAWTAANLAADLAAARGQRLDLMHAENVSVAAAFDLSYQDLPADQQRLFRRLGLHPGADIDAYAAAALDGASLAAARRGLEVLYDNHLLEEPSRGRYRFHDLIREHARALAEAAPAADREAAADRLLSYYAHTACVASQHLARRAPAVPPGPPPAAPPLAGRSDSVAWMDAEYLNLGAAARSAADRGRPGCVVMLASALNGYLLVRGHWSQGLPLHRLAIEAARQAGDPLAEAAGLVHLGVVERLTGDHPAAAASFTRALALFREHGDRPGEAHALNELGVTQYLTADYPAATASLGRALDLCRAAGDREAESGALNDLGIVQQAAGRYQDAAASFAQALAMHRALGDRLWEANALNNMGAVQRLTGRCREAAVSHRQALEIYRDLGNGFGEARALTHLAAVECATGDHPAAASHCEQALRLYRDLGNQAGEAEALNNLGVAQRLSGRHAESAASLELALRLYREQGIALGEAEVLNSVGELALAAGQPAQAASRHQRALLIAETIAAPAEQGRAFEGLGESSLRLGQRDAGIAQLARAMAIYEGIGAFRAARVRAAIRAAGGGGAGRAAAAGG